MSKTIRVSGDYIIQPSGFLSIDSDVDITGEIAISDGEHVVTLSATTDNDGNVALNIETPQTNDTLISRRKSLVHSIIF